MDQQNKKLEPLDWMSTWKGSWIIIKREDAKVQSKETAETESYYNLKADANQFVDFFS